MAFFLGSPFRVSMGAVFPVAAAAVCLAERQARATTSVCIFIGATRAGNRQRFAHSYRSHFVGPAMADSGVVYYSAGPAPAYEQRDHHQGEWRGYSGGPGPFREHGLGGF